MFYVTNVTHVSNVTHITSDNLLITSGYAVYHRHRNLIQNTGMPSTTTNHYYAATAAMGHWLVGSTNQIPISQGGHAHYIISVLHHDM